MEFDDVPHQAVLTAGEVKAKMVEFATSPPFEKHLRRLVRDTVESSPQLVDPEIHAVERLLFEFRYDDDTTVIDRFLRRPDLTQTERDMAVGFTRGVEGFFEIVTEAGPGAPVF